MVRLVVDIGKLDVTFLFAQQPIPLFSGYPISVSILSGEIPLITYESRPHAQQDRAELFISVSRLFVSLDA